MGLVFETFAGWKETVNQAIAFALRTGFENWVSIRVIIFMPDAPITLWMPISFVRRLAEKDDSPTRPIQAKKMVVYPVYKDPPKKEKV
jgi:hypothetical protein